MLGNLFLKLLASEVDGDCALSFDLAAAMQ
jgi:hypothetical protein